MDTGKKLISIDCLGEYPKEAEYVSCNIYSTVVLKKGKSAEEIKKEVSNYLDDIQSRIDVRYEELSTIERKEYSELNSEEKKKLDFCRSFQIIRSEMDGIWFKIGGVNDIGFRKALYQLLQLLKEDEWLR